MPELPEVHALAADLSSRLGGRTVERLDMTSFTALKTFDPPATALSGAVVEAVVRHGKFLDFRMATDPGMELHLIAHLVRAGWVRWRQSPPKPARPGKGQLAARLVLDEGSAVDFTEAGTKKSLALWLVPDPLDVPQVPGLGPDPLREDFTAEQLAEILQRAGRAQIKGVLRSQSTIAGIGNAYSDEILHAAGISPYQAAVKTDAVELLTAIRSTLSEAVERSQGSAAADLKAEKKAGLRVHGRAGERCPVCATVIREVIFADRSMQYCPTCQTGGKVLADRGLSRLLK